jgi:hypothetical protein
MKRETLTHPKTYSLATRLGVSRATAIGHLRLLWDFAAIHATAGDIGKWDDKTIAAACDWTGDASTFVDSLVDSGWLDRVVKYRLTIHDWVDHCERWVKLRAKKLQIKLIGTSTRSIERVEKRKNASTAVGVKDHKDQKETKDHKDQKETKDHKDQETNHLPPNLKTDRFVSVWSRWVGYRKEIKKPLTPTAVAQQLADLASWGEPLAVQAIESSIRNSWQGLFDPREKSNGRSRATTGPGQTYDPNAPTDHGF